MNNKEYADLVNQGKFPSDIIIPRSDIFDDDRGTIENLWLGNSGSTTLIISKQGAVRAKHTHINGDWHSCYIIEGQLIYIEEENSVRKEYCFGKGDHFFTKPEVYHEMHFLTDCVMITMNGISKSPIEYEKHLVRGK